MESAIAGLQYRTGGTTSLTEADGTFRYAAGDLVEFSVGGIQSGGAMGKSILSPLGLVADASGVSDRRVVNVARLLLTLDDDGTPDDAWNIRRRVVS